MTDHNPQDEIIDAAHHDAQLQNKYDKDAKK